eukprot:gene7225-9856_t
MNDNNNTRRGRPGRQRQTHRVRENYSAAWIEALKENVGNIEYHHEMLNILNSIPENSRNNIPLISPPPYHSRRNSSINNEQNNQQSQRRDRMNMFSSLDDHDVIPNNVVQGNAVITNNRNIRRPILSQDSNNNQQVRYLIVRTECGLGEAIRLSAKETERGEMWAEMATIWQDAYTILNDSLSNIDHWTAILLQAREDDADPNIVLQDGHMFNVLDELLEGLQLVRDHTEEERSQVITRLNGKLRNIIHKLNPLRQSRDVVRARVGENRWTHNPNPRMDFAERIIELNNQKVILDQTIETINSLLIVNVISVH